MISPWNEANHRSQPTFKNPKRAAQYYNVVRKYCRGLQDRRGGRDRRGEHGALAKVFKKTAKKPRIWGLHNYRDTNKRKGQRLGGTKRLLKAVKGDVWLTETGGIVKFVLPERPHAVQVRREPRQQRDEADVRARQALPQSRIKRLYIYHWHAVPPAQPLRRRADPSDGTARPAYNTVRNQLATAHLQPVAVDSRRERLARAAAVLRHRCTAGPRGAARGGARRRGGHGPAPRQVGE